MQLMTSSFHLSIIDSVSGIVIERVDYNTLFIIYRIMLLSSVVSPTFSQNNERTRKRRHHPKRRKHVLRRNRQYYETNSCDSEVDSHASAPPEMLSTLSSPSSETFHASEDETLSDIVCSSRCGKLKHEHALRCILTFKTTFIWSINIRATQQSKSSAS